MIQKLKIKLINPKRKGNKNLLNDEAFFIFFMKFSKNAINPCEEGIVIFESVVGDETPVFTRVVR